MSFKRRGIYEKIVNMILDILIVIFGFFLLVFIYNNVQIKILGNNYSSFFGYSTFEVQTGSMADTINPGDWIIVKVTKNIKLDDIITYSQEGEFITHRVVETYKDSFITKGDANNSKDKAISKSQVVGKVVKILPCFGIIRKTFFNPVILLMLLLSLYSISYVLRNVNNVENNINKDRFSYKRKMDAFVNCILSKLISYIKNKIKHNDDVSQENLELIDEEQYAIDDLQIQMSNISEEDMDKTLYFRRIEVEKVELDNIKNTEKKISNNELEYDENINTETLDKNEVEEKISIIQNKRKKFKNIVEKVIYFKKEELNKIIDVLLLEEKLQTNEFSIRDELLITYVDGKYYNFCGNVNVGFNKKTVGARIDQEIQKKGNELIETYKGNDNKYSDKVNKYISIFKLINRLEQINAMSDNSKKRKLYKEKILKMLKNDDLSSIELKEMIKKIIKIQKLYRYMIEVILEKSSTNDFNLILSKISGYKNMYAVSVDHNIMFSKVYSDYIVDKTYSEGIIAEDKVIVLLNLLLINVVKDMLDLEENKKYFIQLPNSVYLKPNKLDKIFKLLEDEYAKNNVIIVVDSNSLIEYNVQIMELRKKGYKFAVSLVGELRTIDNKYLEIAEYLFGEKDQITYNLISSLPDSLVKNIINDDIVNKLNSFGGEE